jgi:hypothetical protein
VSKRVNLDVSGIIVTAGAAPFAFFHFRVDNLCYSLLTLIFLVFYPCNSIVIPAAPRAKKPGSSRPVH